MRYDWITYTSILNPTGFNFPADISVDNNDNLYVADTYNNRI